MPTKDDHGTFIGAEELPKGVKPPYRFTAVYEGVVEDWHLVVQRLDGDDLAHVVITNRRTGIVHAARLPVTTPREAKLWALQQPEDVEEP